MKKVLKTCALLAILFLCFSCNKTPPTEPGLNAVSSLKKIGDRAYSLEYFGDYLLDALINADVKDEAALRKYLESDIPNWKTYAEISSKLKISLPDDFACSSLVAANKDSAGGQIYGRNFDWLNDTGILLLHSKPTKGFESISTTSSFCLEFMQYGRKWEPENNSEKAVTLMSVFVPMDGLNEKGLYVSILDAGNTEKTAQATKKHDVTTTVAVRYLLDHADSVDKALKLLRDIDMHSVLGTAYHFAIADNTGKSVVVEWYDDEMYVTETHAVTNHYISSVCLEKAKNQKPGNSEERYNTLMQIGSSKNWTMSQTEVRDAMKSVLQHDHTVWTTVYEPDKRRATYYFHEDYTKPVVVEF